MKKDFEIPSNLKDLRSRLSNLTSWIREKGLDEYALPVIVLLGVVVLIVGGSVVSGITVEENDRPCYTEKIICHGVSAGETAESCVGFTRKSVNFENGGSCEIQKIQETCESVGEYMCSEGNPEDWMAEAKVYGKSCSTWNSKYRLGMSSCQQ